MIKARKNPFHFGDPVEKAFYFGRPGLDRLVAEFLNNHIHVVLIGPRRFGKTSFILNFLQDRHRQGKACLFLDVFNITSHRDFLQQILRALKAQQSWSQRLREWIAAIPRLRPRLTFENDPLTGRTEIALSGAMAEMDVKETIQDILAALGSLGDEVIVAIDEFQKIAELDDNGWLEATLRTHMQSLPNTAFIFTGSRKSVINDMLNNQARPFYRSCQTIDFPAFGEDFTDWIVERFASVSVKCDAAAVRLLRREMQDTPNYVQMVCFHLVAAGITHVTEDEVGAILPRIVHQNAYAYQTLLGALSLVQQRALRLAAIETEQIFSKDILARYEIGSGPALASALKSLKHKQILDENAGRGRVVFDDPLFAIWLRAEFG